MLKYQKIILVAILIIMFLAVAGLFLRVSLWIFAGIIFVVTVLMIYGSVSLKSGFYTQVICHADTTRKVIALTFDDGPDEVVTPQVLDVLKKYKIEAAFFCIGSKVLRNPQLIRQIDNEGHVLGGHSFSHHFFFDLYSKSKMTEEMITTDKMLRQIIHKTIQLFRPPYGVMNPSLAGAVKKMNYIVIGWSLKSRDTVINDEQKLYERLIKKLRKHEIILFHDTKSHMVRVLEKFILFARENNYEFERLDKLLQITAYE
jgi:peptidoglycan-N-acetylglucosamine deacetylase